MQSDGRFRFMALFLTGAEWRRGSDTCMVCDRLVLFGLLMHSCKVFFCLGFLQHPGKAVDVCEPATRVRKLHWKHGLSGLWFCVMFLLLLHWLLPADTNIDTAVVVIARALMMYFHVFWRLQIFHAKAPVSQNSWPHRLAAALYLCRPAVPTF